MKYKRENRAFHFHHYNLGFVMMLFICYQDSFMTFLHAVFNGIMIEGLARWGADDLWEKQDDPCTRTKQAITALD